MNTYDIYGWYSADKFPDRVATAPDNTSETTTTGDMRANWTGYAWVDMPYQAPPPVVSPAPEVPQSVSMRQACIQLELDGLLDDVELVVAGLPRTYQIEWQRASVVARDNSLVEIVRQQQGMTAEQIDTLFINASNL